MAERIVNFDAISTDGLIDEGRAVADRLAAEGRRSLAWCVSAMANRLHALYYVNGDVLPDEPTASLDDYCVDCDGGAGPCICGAAPTGDRT